MNIRRCWKFRTLLFVTFAVCKVYGSPCAVLDTGSSSICIPIDEINSAFRQAKLAFDLLEPVDFSPHRAQYHHHEIDQLGLVLVETSRILAKSFDLDHEQIFDFLPQLDIELTDIWKFCPAIFKKKTCKISKYRTLSGHCNNLNHPDWGASVTPFRHLLPSDRHDGISEPREYGQGLASLPSARLVSTKIHQDKVVHDHAVTIMLIAWGQILDHDITFTAETKDLSSGKDFDCCSENIFVSKPKPKHHNCYPIRVPHDDSFYSKYTHHCMNFARSFAGVRPKCSLGPRTAFNTISSFLDASTVYGSDTELGKELRSGEGGTLRTLPFFKEHELKDLLPLKVDEPDDGCIRPNSDIFCFLAGDKRVNEQLVLTTLHTIFMREHNRIAHSLAEINPHWDDEKLYQETRRIIIAMQQHITYNEFLPMILGRELLHEYGLSIEDVQKIGPLEPERKLFQINQCYYASNQAISPIYIRGVEPAFFGTAPSQGYWTGYDPSQNPGALEEFITSAFRFGHSLLPHKIERWTTSHHLIESTKLHELLRQPFDMFRPGYTDTFIMGLVNQLAQVMDEGVTDQVTNMLFKEKGKHFGMDLAAMNIQRGRDHGVPPFAAYRKVCGLSEIKDWDDLIGIMRNDTIYKYKSIYRSAWDIDLWSGGVSEIPLTGSLLGSTFGCIIAKQFQALRFGDRFWFELPDLPSSFTLDQVNEIKSMKLSRLLCDNGDAIKTIQVYAMVHPDHKINPRVSCNSKVLPGIDLEHWRDSRKTSSFITGIQAPEDEDTDQSIMQKAHLYIDLKTLKPPLYDGAFLKSERPEKSHNESTPHETSTTPPTTSHGKFGNSPNTTTPTPTKLEHPFYEKYIPPFRKIPEDNFEDHKDININGPSTKPNNGEYDYDDIFEIETPGYYPNPFPPQEYDFPPHFTALPRPLPRKPSLFSVIRNRNKLLLKLFRRRRKNMTFRLPNIRPFPNPPLSGLRGMFSSNLLRQKFRIRG